MKLSEHILLDGNKKSLSRDFMGGLAMKERARPLCESPPVRELHKVEVLFVQF